jgi:dTDP-4-amino-4,6-dideoxygalactose transaminase
MNIPLIDLKAQYESLKKELDGAVVDVMASGQFVLGPKVAELEEAMASYFDVEHAVGVASGTDALIMALHGCDIGPGDEVICPTYTFFATAEAILKVGATPVFVDIDPQTYALDPGKVSDAITDRTEALIPVHLYGHAADMTAIAEIASAHDLHVIEDNAQAFGAKWEGSLTGALGDAGCLSFFPSKNLGAFGDAGLIITNDENIAGLSRMLRTHGWRRKYYPEVVGYNSRLDALQAAILLVKMQHVDEWNGQRRQIARLYSEKLADLEIGRPTVARGAEHVYHMYMIRTPRRDQVRKYLTDHGIGCAVYYPVPLHLTEPCLHLGHQQGDFPEAEKAAQETLALPIFPEMQEAQIDQVVAVLREALAQS